MLSKEVKELVTTVVTEGYEEARRRVPLFTDQIFAWVAENRMNEAFTQFLAAFVDKAIVKSVDLLAAQIAKAGSDDKDDEGAAD